MRPQPVAYATDEGSDWRNWADRHYMDLRHVHAIKFSDGSVWDCIHGWRNNLSSEKAENAWKLSEELHPGPTASTNTPNNAPSSESDTPTASISSKRPEDILLAALDLLKNLPPSSAWSLELATEQLNISCGKAQVPATTSPSLDPAFAGLLDHLKPGQT